MVRCSYLRIDECLPLISTIHSYRSGKLWLYPKEREAANTHLSKGLLPWRVIDTYRKISCIAQCKDKVAYLHYLGILRIWHYKRLTRKLRSKAGLPLLYDEDDLPDPMYDPNYVHVLSDKQQETLHYSEPFY